MVFQCDVRWLFRDSTGRTVFDGTGVRRETNLDPGPDMDTVSVHVVTFQNPPRLTLLSIPLTPDLLTPLPEFEIHRIMTGRRGTGSKNRGGKVRTFGRGRSGDGDGETEFGVGRTRPYTDQSRLDWCTHRYSTVWGGERVGGSDPLECMVAFPTLSRKLGNVGLKVLLFRPMR